MRPINPLLRRTAFAVLSASVSTAALAQSAEPWEGTFETNFGEVRLVQDGDRVYGDYDPDSNASDGAYIEARVSEDGRVLRGTYQKINNRTDNGMIEFALTGDGFTGDWQYTHRTREPDWERATWNGVLVSPATPRLRHAVGREHYYNDSYFRTVSRLRNWSFFGRPVDVNATVLWQDRAEARRPYPIEHGDASGQPAGIWAGTWTTNHGAVKIVQDGRRVYGEYGNRGVIEGRTIGNGDIVRGTWQHVRDDDDNGFFEFRMDDGGFVGGWTYRRDGLASAGQNNWRGRLDDRSTPRLDLASENRVNAARWIAGTTRTERQWLSPGGAVLVPETVARTTVPPLGRPEIANRFPGEMHAPGDDGGEEAFPGEMHAPDGDGGEQAFPGEMHAPAGGDSDGSATRETRQQAVESGSQDRDASVGQRYAHIPALADWEGSSPPRYVDFGLGRMYLENSSGFREVREGGIFGTVELQVLCETARGVVKMPVFGNRSPVVFRRSTDKERLASVYGEKRRFVLDQQCLADRDAHIVFQLKTDLELERVGRNIDFGFEAKRLDMRLLGLNHLADPQLDYIYNQQDGPNSWNLGFGVSERYNPASRRIRAEGSIVLVP